MAQKEIPCYLFVGMLESGKTKFIQETMEDPQFDSGDKTLLLICEEGEEEYDSERFAFGGVTVATIEDKAELNREHLQQLAEKSDCGRVIIEYNGMWLVQELYDALPDNWLIYQCLATADGTTIKTYANDNAMRGLLLDKLRGSELLVVNRAEARVFQKGFGNKLGAQGVAGHQHGFGKIAGVGAVVWGRHIRYAPLCWIFAAGWPAAVFHGLFCGPFHLGRYIFSIPHFSVLW